MINWLAVILILAGMLSLMVYPKIIKMFLFALIFYLTVFVDYWWAGLFIPLLIIILIYKKKKELKYGI